MNSSAVMTEKLKERLAITKKQSKLLFLQS